MLEICGAAVQAQQEASAALTELGLSHAAAVFTNGGLLKPDLVVMMPSARVALSMDQPSAFCINPPHRPLGDTILSWRLLVLHDWQVCSDPPLLGHHCILVVGFSHVTQFNVFVQSPVPQHYVLMKTVF